MSLATRCPACSTVFRVVHDQLRVSEGWVRCGQCQEVFNALETLFDLGPPGQSPASEPAAADFTDVAGPNSVAPPAEPVEPATEADDWPTAPYEASPPQLPDKGEADVAEDLATAELPAAPVLEPEGPVEAPSLSRFMGPVPDWSRRSARSRRRKAKPASGTLGEPHAHVSQGARRRRRQPGFVRQAEQAASWRRPWVRAGLGAAAGALMLLLGLQAGYQYRDDLAARVPALQPALQAGCTWHGCRLSAPLALERFRLDSSDLTRTERDQVLRFTAELHNTADHAVRLPALEVTFTDSLGQVLARKVMLPAALAAHGEAIGADAPWRVDARLAVGELQIAGYTVEVFYP
jgi:predicted Zn finger-like uncharacterized protein